jgi:hypothetical protein
MPTTSCFSYPPDMLPGPGNPSSVQPPRPRVRSMPLTCYSYPLSCFSYPDDMPSATGNPDLAQPALRRMPYGTCFRY